MSNMKSGDVAWMAILAGVVVYELAADDLLSEATERYVARHPVLTRAAIVAIAGHLACLMPTAVDVFSAKNIFHKGVVHVTRTDRNKRVDRSIG